MPDEESYLDVSLRKIAKGAGVGFIGSIFGMFLGYLSRVIIARLLNASDYGIICLGFTAMSIAYTLALLGIYGGVQRFVAFHIGKKDVRRAKGTILTAFAICCVSSLVTSILIVRYADWLSVFVFHEDALAPVLRAFAIAVPSMVFTNLSISITLGFQEVKYKVYINDILQNASKIILITAAILLGFGVVGAAWGWSISIIAMGFISLYIIKKVFPPLFFRDVKAIFECRELIAYSLPLFLAGVSGLVMTWTDTLMLGYFATPADVGIYNVASPTAKLISAIGGSFSVIFFPVISGLLAMQRLEEIKVTYSVVTKWILMILTPIVVLAAAFPEHIIGIIFGAEYITGAHALGVLSLSYFLCSLFGPATQVLSAYGRTKAVMTFTFLGAFMNVVLNAIFIPKLGVFGAALATGVSNVVSGISRISYLFYTEKMQPFRFTYIKPLTASLISIAIVYPLKYITGVSIFSLAFMLMLYLIFYFFLTLVFRSFEEEDLVVMRAIEHRLGIKAKWVRNSIQRFL